MGALGMDPYLLPATSRMTNRHSSGPPGLSYDANGNLLNDSYHSYTWDADDHMASVDSNNVTYDALGRMVENFGSQQFIYLAGGEMPFEVMNGSAIVLGYVHLPGGGSAIYNSSGLAQYNRPDWLGSARLRTTPSRTLAGTAPRPVRGILRRVGFSVDPVHLEWKPWSASGLDDFMYRRYHPTQGRWASRDPAGMAAADPATRRAGTAMHTWGTIRWARPTRWGWTRGVLPDGPILRPVRPLDIPRFPPVPGWALSAGATTPGPPSCPSAHALDQLPRVGGNWPNGETRACRPA